MAMCIDRALKESFKTFFGLFLTNRPMAAADRGLVKATFANTKTGERDQRLGKPEAADRNHQGAGTLNV